MNLAEDIAMIFALLIFLPLFFVWLVAVLIIDWVKHVIRRNNAAKKDL